MGDDEWLGDYYSKITNDKNADLRRKDTFTNWALVSLLGLLAVYGQFMDSPPFTRIAALVIALILIVRFFAHSCISYANICKLNRISDAVENYWMKGSPDLDRIMAIILHYDRHRWSTMTRSKTAWGQLKGGFLIILLAPLLGLGYEMMVLTPSSLTPSIFLGLPLELLILLLFLIFIIWELAIFLTFKPLRYKQLN